MSLASFRKKYIDWKLILLLAAFYTLFDLVYIMKLFYMRSYVIERVHESWHDILINNILIDWLIVVAFMSFIAISTKRLLNKNYPWTRIFIFHTIFAILIGLVIRIVFDLQGILMGNVGFSDYSLKASIDRMFYVMDLNFLIYFAMIFIIYTYYYLKQVKETEKQKSQLENQLMSTKMKMLSSQLQPHFLFNTLNSISVLVEVDAKKAQNTIADLSDFLREILYSGDQYMVSLRKELRILEYYLNILNVRFSDHLHIEKDIDPDLLDQKIPALLLQPLIENSVKHGYSYHHTDLRVKMSIQRKKKDILIKIENDGAELTKTCPELLKEGVGLANINDRLRNLYGENFYFNMQNKEDHHGVETLIRIPLVFQLKKKVPESQLAEEPKKVSNQ